MDFQYSWVCRRKQLGDFWRNTRRWFHISRWCMGFGMSLEYMPSGWGTQDLCGTRVEELKIHANPKYSRCFKHQAKELFFICSKKKVLMKQMCNCNRKTPWNFKMLNFLRGLHSTVGEPTNPSGHAQIGRWLVTVQVAKGAQAWLSAQGLRHFLFWHAL